ncbi:Ulp1 protease family, C-terminal catalytic domain [Dillenia turbinata]|uniref:Ulp1 protease family, C-terminal catalytic domain n=1 Tax=Dillenia turbinata TaxID=194707 RepID=A0AAN8VCT5_9MAGN
MEVEKVEKRPTKLDLEKLFAIASDDEADPVPELVVLPSNHHREEGPRRGQNSEMDDEQREMIDRLSDHELNQRISRNKSNLGKLASKLPDKGAKLKAQIDLYESECERRRLIRMQEDNGDNKPRQSKNSSTSGISDGHKQQALSGQNHPKPSFASRFREKLEDTGSRIIGAFSKELSQLGRCDHGNTRQKGQTSKTGMEKPEQLPSKRPNDISTDKRRCILANSNHKRKSSICSVKHLGENLCTAFSRKMDASEVVPLTNLRLRKGQTVVLLDEEESQLVERQPKMRKLDECLKGEKIYYPSRDDPECVEISYSDVECLAPDACLTSPIMNFYIRYLQQPRSSRERARCNYHFFNTYFYKKLTDAVSHKGDKGAFFSKFRRWWKGVNIFKMAYILLPIHESIHWSLAIICIPDKEDESGPRILHLDSLGLHDSRSVFDNIKSFLREEWYCLNQEGPSDLPIAKRIWKNLPRRIDEEKVPVPQQKNDSDCGLFVLYFMERFLEEAPERLKKKDLAMFGKNWFKPQEPSSLRGKIRDLLEQEFRRGSGNDCMLEPTLTSSKASPVETVDIREDS